MIVPDSVPSNGLLQFNLLIRYNTSSVAVFNLDALVLFVHVSSVKVAV